MPCKTLFLDSSTCRNVPGGKSGYMVKSSLPIYPYVYLSLANWAKYVNGTTPHFSTMRLRCEVRRESKLGSRRVGIWTTEAPCTAFEQCDFGGSVSFRSEAAKLRSTPYQERISRRSQR